MPPRGNPLTVAGLRVRTLRSFKLSVVAVNADVSANFSDPEQYEKPRS